MEIIDSHCHLNHQAFDLDRQDIIKRAITNNVSIFIVPGTVSSQWQSLIELAEIQQSIRFSLGLHPYYINQHSDDDLTKLVKLLNNTDAIAIGEIGLDFYDKNLDPIKQLRYFDAQLKIAQELKLPVIIHARKSYDEIIKSLNKISFNQGGIIHAFNGSIQHAMKLIEMNFKLGFGGMLTFEHSTKLRKLATSLPIESIVLETDAPDMTGANHKGQRNSPEYLPEVLNVLSNLRNESIELIAETTTNNVKSVLHL